MPTRTTGLYRTLLLSASILGAIGAATSGAPAASPIDTAQPFYNASGLGTTVLPDFKGGTLVLDQIYQTYAQDFLVENYATNTISGKGVGIFSGVWSGNGPITITGSGDVSFTGNNTYSGTITASPGSMLRIVGSGSFLGNIVANSNVILSSSGGSYTFAGDITQQSGGPYVMVEGSVILTSQNITAPFALDGANLQIGNGTGADDLTIYVKGYNGASGTLIVNRPGTTTIHSDLYSGSFRVTGGGTAIIRGALGSTTIDAGSALETRDAYAAYGIVNNGNLTIAGPSPTGFYGVISGTGSVQVNSNATFFTDTTYTGPTTVSEGATLKLMGSNVSPLATVAGKLQFGEVTASGTFSGDIATVGQGVVEFERTDTYVYGGTISGTGSLVKGSGGTVILTGTNSYSGGTWITAGTLQIGSGDTSGSITGNVVDDATLVFDRSDDFVFDGDISGGGIVYLTGGGTLRLTGSVTNTRGFVAQNGTIIYGFDQTVLKPGGYNIRGVIRFNQSDTFQYDGVLSGRGDIVQVGTGTTVLTGENTFTGGTTITHGTLQLGNGGTTGSIVGNVVDNGTLAFNRSNTIIFPWQISGSGGLNKLGTGTLVLDGVNSYSGPTTVSSGILVVGDAAHPGATVAGNASVASGATLRGYGRIAGAVANTSGGTVAPGSSIGTLTVGSYSQGSTSTLGIEVSPTDSSKLQVGGQASIAGTLALQFDPGTYGTRTYHVLSGANVSGQFGQLSVTNAPAGSLYGIAYAPTGADIVIETSRPTQMYSDLIEYAFDGAAAFNDAVFDHQASRYCNGVASAGNRTEFAQCPDVETWWQAFGGAGSHDGSNVADAFNARWAGVVGGFDVETEWGFSAGFAAFYTRGVLDIAGDNGRATVDSYGLSLNGSFAALYGRFDANAYWTENASQAHWHITPDGASPLAVNSKPKNHAFGGAVQYSRPVVFDDLTGIARAVYTGVDQPSFSQSGNAPFDVTASAKTYSSVYGEALLQLSHVYKLRNNAAVIPEASLGVRADISRGSRDSILSLAEASGPDFAIPGAQSDRVDFVASLGVTLKRRDGILLSLRGQSEMGAHERMGTVMLGGQIQF